MINEIWLKSNFIDILVGCIILWCLYVGVTKGFAVEIFKLLGILFATFITLHYYIRLAEFLNGFISIPEIVCIISSFVLLWIISVVTFKFIRDGMIVVLNLKPHPILNRWGSGLIAFIRGMLTGGLLFCLILLLGNKYLAEKAQTSFSGKYLINISPNFYNSVFDNFIGKLFPAEEKNEAVFKVIKRDKKK